MYVLPRNTSVVGRTRGDVGRKEGPVPALRDTYDVSVDSHDCGSRARTRRKGHRHGMQAQHLTEGHLLTSLDRLSLDQQSGDLTAVQMRDKTPVAALAPPCELDIELNELTNSSKRVVVDTLLRRRLTQHVSEKGSVVDLLRRHEGDESPVLSHQAGIDEVLVRECRKAIVEQIKLDELLVQAKVDGFEVEIALDHVPGQCAVDTLAACDERLALDQ